MMATKAYYEQKIASQLAEWRAEIDLLKAKAETLSVEMKAKSQEKIDLLEIKLAEGQTKLKELEKSSEDAWEAVKDGAESIWETMKSAFEDAKSKFK